jgi:hypothetical protein
MLDFVISKVAMIMAAVFILLAGIGIYEIQKSAMEDEELQNIADTISKTVNELSAINANTEVNISFDRYRGGIYLKSTVGNKGYTIEITRNLLFITQEGRRISSNFIGLVHLWKPELRLYDASQIASKDHKNNAFDISSGDDVVIFVESRQIEGSGSGYRTFVYWFPA